MGDFLTFRRLITTEVIQVVFWLASIGIVIASIGAIADDEPLAGVCCSCSGCSTCACSARCSLCFSA